MSAPDRITVTPFGVVSTDYRDGEYVWAKVHDGLLRRVEYVERELRRYVTDNPSLLDVMAETILDLLDQLETSPGASLPAPGGPDARARPVRESSTDGQGNTLPPAPSNSSPVGGTAAAIPSARAGDGCSPPRDAPPAGGGPS